LGHKPPVKGLSPVGARDAVVLVVLDVCLGLATGVLVRGE